MIFLVFLSCSSLGQEIILIRHARVNLDTKGIMFPGEAAVLREAYDTAGIYSFMPDTVLNKIPKRKTDTIYTSSLKRSILTAHRLFGDSVVYVPKSLFDEFELHVLRLPLLLPYKVWTGISRLGWFVGMKNENSENRSEGVKRAKLAARFIETKSKVNGQVIMVTHGFINRNITNELKKGGWTVVQKKGRENLGATVLTR